ncbi:MAG: hypothetical protein KBS60_05550 [Phascolarctobacterium sp.]|nr:hypothetical protein [Candidatus Phascolarctobacterium caballi]
MKKIVMAFFMAFVVSATAFAGGNPFYNMYKGQAHREMQRGVAQLNYIIIDEEGNPIPDVTLRYVDRYNNSFSAQADIVGKVHMDIRKPSVVQVYSLLINGEEYRIIGRDIVEEIEIKDVGKGEVEYFVIQKNSDSKSAYIYDAD